MENERTSRTLRLIMPQWQGGNGNNLDYHFGSRLLAWLAPESDDETIEVPIDTGLMNHEKEDGILAKQQLIKQANEAFDILQNKQPDRVVVLGGECSVELVPFAYLLEKYKDDVAILWIDAHPDIKTPEYLPNYQAMVLATLLGEGDDDFASLVPTRISPSNVVFAGINKEIEKEPHVYQKYNFNNVSSRDFESSSGKILDLLKATGVSRVAVHFDLDVLDLQEFRSQGGAKPGRYEKNVREWPKGSSIKSVGRLIQDVSEEFDVVGLGITEHLPWDAIALSNLLSSLPLLRK